jgi:hypothetical protein
LKLQRKSSPIRRGCRGKWSGKRLPGRMTDVSALNARLSIRLGEAR